MCGVPSIPVPFHFTMRSCQLVVFALALLLLAVQAKKAPREEEAESWSHSSKKYSKDHQKPHHFEHKKEVPEVNEADPRAKQAPLEVPEPEIELQGHLEKSHKVLAEENEKDLHLQDLAYEESLEKRHRKQEVDKKKSGSKAEKKLFADQEEVGQHSVDEKVIEDSFEPLEQEQEKPKKSKKQQKEKQQQHKEDKKQQKEEKKKHKEDKKHNKKAHEKKSKDKQKQKEGKKKYNKKEHKKH